MYQSQCFPSIFISVSVFFTSVPHSCFALWFSPAVVASVLRVAPDKCFV